MDEWFKIIVVLNSWDEVDDLFL